MHAWPMPSRLRRSERRRHENICGKFLHNAVASTSNYTHTHTHSNSTTIVLRVPSTIAGTEICLRCWRDRPFLNRTHLVFVEVVPMGRQEATQPNSDIQHNRTAFKRNKQTRGMWILRKNAKDLENHQRLKRKPSFSVLQSWANLWNVSCSWSCSSCSWS